MEILWKLKTIALSDQITLFWKDSISEAVPLEINLSYYRNESTPICVNLPKLNFIVVHIPGAFISARRPEHGKNEPKMQGFFLITALLYLSVACLVSDVSMLRFCFLFPAYCID